MRQVDEADTIVAVASATGPAERGVIRLSGPDAVTIAERLTGQTIAVRSGRRLGGRVARCELAGAERSVPVDLLVWPDHRSYTQQPSVEIHAPSSAPVLEALARACRVLGARPAEPGEFTLRAFLAGRLDLTQAEAVLSVIEAREAAQLDAALDQMAGGLSAPLKQLRGDLLGLLADLEAGLDFVEEEDVRFVSREELLERLEDAADLVAETAKQLTVRDTADRPPRVALVGPPNVGKSTLFNALVERFGACEAVTRALVADRPGVTRDALTTVVEFDGVRVELIDTAGDDATTPADAIDREARTRAAELRDTADVVITCEPAHSTKAAPDTAHALPVATMVDLAAPTAGWIPVSGTTGAGLERLATAVRDRLREEAADVTATAAQRSRDGLDQAAEALRRASATAEADAGEELVSLELRTALDGLGRVVGEVVTDEVLGEIFGRFCIGK